MIEQPIDRLMNKLIAIKLLWRLFCYLCYPSILIWWFRVWIISNTLDPPSEAFVIWCLVSYTRYTLLMLYILYQIYTFVNSRLGSSQSSLHISNCIITKLSRHISVKLGCHWPTRPWLLSSSHYSGYQMRKLTSITKEEDQLCPNGFSTSPPTVVFKGGKPHALTSGQSLDGFDNLSCVCMSEWEYTFWVTYVFRWQRRLFT